MADFQFQSQSGLSNTFLTVSALCIMSSDSEVEVREESVHFTPARSKYVDLISILCWFALLCMCLFVLLFVYLFCSLVYFSVLFLRAFVCFRFDR